MSSIFSDPPFARGATLLAGDLSDTGTGVNLPGGEVVGSIKVFQDVDPYTSKRLSNRLVYCCAVRYKGSDTTGPAIAGKVYAIDLAHENGKAFASISAVATNANVAANRHYGVVDEYLASNDNLAIKNGDVLWLVVKGPTQGDAAGNITQGLGVEVGATGKVAQLDQGSVIGSQIADGNSSAGLTRINLNSNAV